MAGSPTAFQADSYQNDAFQIETGVVVPAVNVGGGGFNLGPERFNKDRPKGGRDNIRKPPTLRPNRR